jgi:hypothetical protein
MNVFWRGTIEPHIYVPEVDHLASRLPILPVVAHASGILSGTNRGKYGAEKID